MSTSSDKTAAADNIINAISKCQPLTFPSAKPVRVVAQIKHTRSELYICSLKFCMGPHYLDTRLSFFNFNRTNPEHQYGVAMQWPQKTSTKFTRFTVNVEERNDGRICHHAEPDAFRLSSCHLKPGSLAKKVLSGMGFCEDDPRYLPTRGGFNLLAADEVNRHIKWFLQFALILMCYRKMLGGKGRLRDHYIFLQVLGEKLDKYGQAETRKF